MSKSKTAVHLQIDILYHIDTDLVAESYARDVHFFSELGEAASQWEMQPNEPRRLVNYDFRHQTGEAIEEEE